jgi:MFS family permease
VIAEAFGWQWVFIGLVLPGLLVALACWFMREPYRGLSERVDGVREGRVSVETAAEPPPVVEGGKAVGNSVWDDLRVLWRVPALRALYICTAVLFFGLGGLFYFTPTFFKEEFGVDTDRAAAISGSIGMVGILVGATLGIRYGGKYVGVRDGWRMTVGSVGLGIGAVGVLILALSQALPVAIAGFLIVNLGFMIAIPNLAAAVADLSGAVMRGMGFSVNQLVVGFSALGPLMIGVAADLVSFNFAYALFVPPLAVAAFLGFRAHRGYDRDVEAAERASLEAFGYVVEPDSAERQEAIDRQILE